MSPEDAGGMLETRRAARMKLSRTSSYALQAVLQLARSDSSGTPIPCSRLAADGKMPERFLLQILRSLVTHGILGSTRGVVGGYCLERSPEDISLLDVIEAVDGPVVPTLPIHEGLSDEANDKLKCVMATVTDLARRELAAIKLVHLLPPGEASELAAG
jgi:Rrf2 family transcriptional regulator, cysteine metabolism repressor